MKEKYKEKYDKEKYKYGEKIEYENVQAEGIRERRKKKGKNNKERRI